MIKKLLNRSRFKIVTKIEKNSTKNSKLNHHHDLSTFVNHILELSVVLAKTG